MIPRDVPPASASVFLAEARILIVDDEPANTTILDRLLRQAGYVEIMVTNESRDVLGLYETFNPDLVLLDLHMPEPDGYELLSLLADPAGSGIRPPVVVLTADATRPARERALGLGAADFLTKPLDHLEVLLRIRTQLRTRFLQLELLAQNVDLERVVSERTVALRDTIDRLEQTMDQRERLAEALITAQESERRRIAADIHDDPVQAMVALGMRLELLARTTTDPNVLAAVHEIRGEVTETVEALRELIFRLAPAQLGREGLEAALQDLVERASEARGPRVRLTAVLAREPNLGAAIVAYRIAYEAVNNARRHASAATIRLGVETDGVGLRLVVEDDGTGFALQSVPQATAAGHYGLLAMRQRAELAGGWLEIDTEPGRGTRVTAWIPEEAAADA